MSTRLAPLAVAAILAFAAGAAVGAGGDPRGDTASAFSQAWDRGDYTAMYALLTPAARRRVTLKRFAAGYRRAAKVATLSEVDTGRPAEPQGGEVSVPVVLRTRIFGTLSGRVALPVVESEEGAAVDWRPYLVHPGLRQGETLARATTLPPRAAIQARDAHVLARREARVGGPVDRQVDGGVLAQGMQNAGAHIPGRSRHHDSHHPWLPGPVRRKRATAKGLPAGPTSVICRGPRGRGKRLR